jgi:ABC-type multidrug transport system ATPase subunit
MIKKKLRESALSHVSVSVNKAHITTFMSRLASGTTTGLDLLLQASLDRSYASVFDPEAKMIQDSPSQALPNTKRETSSKKRVYICADEALFPPHLSSPKDIHHHILVNTGYEHTPIKPQTAR